MTVGSRRGSWQIRQIGCSATLPQMLQNFTSRLTRTRVWASRSTSAASAASRWKAIRCALLGPTPGSLPSSSIRSWTAPSYITYGVRSDSETGQAEAAEPRSARDRAHLLFGQLVDGTLGVPHRGDHQVLQRL